METHQALRSCASSSYFRSRSYHPVAVTLYLSTAFWSSLDCQHGAALQRVLSYEQLVRPGKLPSLQLET